MLKTSHSFHLYDRGCSEVCTINQQPDMLGWGAKKNEFWHVARSGSFFWNIALSKIRFVYLKHCSVI